MCCRAESVQYVLRFMCYLYVEPRLEKRAQTSGFLRGALCLCLIFSLTFTLVPSVAITSETKYLYISSDKRDIFVV